MTGISTSDIAQLAYPESQADEDALPERIKAQITDPSEYLVSTSAIDAKQLRPLQLHKISMDWLRQQHDPPARGWIPYYEGTPYRTSSMAGAMLAPDLYRYYLITPSSSGPSQTLSKEYPRARESPFITHKITLSELESIKRLTTMRISPESKSFSFDELD